jgi:hypothetical protein
MNNAPLPNDIAGTVHWKYYGKSDKVNAVGNRNNEFQDGYRTGVESFNCDVNTTIEKEYFIRLEVRDDIRSGFEEWKRGFWAARNQLILIHRKKKANAKSAKKSDSK